MSKLTGSQLIESVANSYRINVAACREANDMLTKENAELRAKLAAIPAQAQTDAAMPTQAQIEAAAKTAWEIYKGYPWPKNQEMWERAIAAALTAATEEPMQIRDARNFVAIRKATIERCAQKCDDGTECGEFYAAAHQMDDALGGGTFIVGFSADGTPKEIHYARAAYGLTIRCS